VEPGSTLSLRLSYDGRRFDAATITRMLGHLQTLLEGIVADPTQASGGAALLTAAERQQLLVDWNATAGRLSAQQCLHHLFEGKSSAPRRGGSGFRRSTTNTQSKIGYPVGVNPKSKIGRH